MQFAFDGRSLRAATNWVRFVGNALVSTTVLVSEEEFLDLAYSRSWARA